MPMLKAPLTFVLEQLFGSTCPGCGLEAPSHRFCAGCSSDWLNLTPHCHGCGAPGTDPCRHCEQSSERAISDLIYVNDFVGPHATLVKRLKYHGDLTLVDPMAFLLAQRFKQRGVRPDILIPMPMHMNRFRSRGFNQADLLARAVSRIIGVPATPILARTRPTDPLEGLSRKAREQVVNGAIAASRRCNGVCAIIDDVYTTGATMHQAARALRQAGASRVTAGAIARTPLSGDTHRTWLNQTFDGIPAGALPRDSR